MKLTKQECREKIQQAARVIRAHETDILNIAQAQIPDFDWKKAFVSSFWECNVSPVGMCIFSIEQNENKRCHYCKQTIKERNIAV